VKYKILGALILASLLGACVEIEASSDQAQTDSKATGSATGHLFEKPYVCERSEERVSKQTGKTRIRTYSSYYHPQLGWRIDDRSSSASLYTQDTRYDGVGADTGGSKAMAKLVGLSADDLKDAKFIFLSAFPYPKPLPEISANNLSKYQKKNCKILDDTSMFEIDYLEKTEVMGQ